jgi:hypothetical protein
MGSCAQQQETERGSCKTESEKKIFRLTVGEEKKARLLGCIYIQLWEAWGVRCCFVSIFYEFEEFYWVVGRGNHTRALG